MFRFYSPILLLQIFCFYHVYTNSKDYKWYLAIAFLPLIGSLLYLYFQFFNQRNIDLVSETIQDVFSGDSKIDKLKKELQFSATINNRINLANEYLSRGAAKLAKTEYEQCLIGAHQGDTAILSKLLQANFMERDFEEVVRIGKKLDGDSLFKGSKERVSYALALQETDQHEIALEEFEKMDINYSNYFQRFHYAQFLHNSNKEEAAKEKLAELMGEIERMDRMEKRYNSEMIRSIKQAYRDGWQA